MSLLMSKTLIITLEAHNDRQQSNNIDSLINKYFASFQTSPSSILGLY